MKKPKPEPRGEVRKTVPIETRGKILPTQTLILRVAAGEAKSAKAAYELSTNIADNSPIVLSKQTGRWFVLSWQEIIEMAIERGIDEETKT